MTRTSTACRATAALAVLSLAIPARGVCVGDCDTSGHVTVAEILTAVNIALGNTLVTACRAGDANQDAQVTIDEILSAVEAALNGCPAAAEGVLLAGDPGGPALAAMVDMPPVAVEQSEVDKGIIMTRLDVRLRPTATVGQVNAALAQVGGGIVTMMPGYPAVTIAIPRPGSVADLVQVAAVLSQAPGIRRASLARERHPAIVPSSDPNFLKEIFYLAPTRFPAAWNARVLTRGCEARKVPIWVIDYFAQPGSPVFGQALFTQFLQEIAQSIFVPVGTWSYHAPPDDWWDTHGYEVTTTLGALFDGPNLTGANPFPNCLDINGMTLDGLSSLQVTMQIASLMQNAPTNAPIITNHSYGYTNECAKETECDANDYSSVIDSPLDRAYDATDWKALTQPYWQRFLTHAGAGNDRGTFGAGLHPALGMAAYKSAMNMATLSDAFYPAIVDTTLWGPLAASAAQYDDFRFYVSSLGLDTAGPADNGLTVGSATSNTVRTLQESTFSNSGPDVKAVGEEVFTFAGVTLGGTSLATPQVAGLASYLWLLSPELRNQPTRVTRQAIVANARANDYTTGIIDAYATILSLDPPAAPAPADAAQGPARAPVRLAILDVNEDGKFDDADVSAFLSHYENPITPEPVDPTEGDHSRFDLNGDGFTGGVTAFHKERFDLDRVGSTQYGHSTYSNVTQNIGSAAITFDEDQLTDMEILCYYAYSPLYSGDTTRRKDLLGTHCVPSADVTYVVGDANTACPGSTCDDDRKAGNAGQYSTPLPLPIHFTASCPSAWSDMTVQKIEEGHIAIDFSASAEPASFCSSSATVVAEGRLPSGVYKVELSSVVTPSTAKLPALYFSLSTPEGTRPYETITAERPPIGSVVVIPKEAVHRWYFWMQARPYSGGAVTVSGRALSIKFLREPDA